jgi:hypothetical protein
MRGVLPGSASFSKISGNASSRDYIDSVIVEVAQTKQMKERI